MSKLHIHDDPDPAGGEELDGEEGLQDEEEQDDLSDLDEETRARLERYSARQAKQHQEQLTRQQEVLRQAGLRVGDDGLSVADMNTARSYFAPLAPAAAPAQQPAAKTQENEEEWVDPLIDPERYHQKLTRVIEDASKPYKEEIAELRQTILQDRIDQAVDKVGQAVEQFAPLYAEALEHPEFESHLRAHLQAMPMSQWRDPRNLCRVVGLLIPDLAPVEKPARRQGGQSPAPQRTPQETARALVNRSTLQQGSPSRDSSSTKGRQFSDTDRLLAERLGIPVEEAWALGQDSTGDQLREVRNARLKVRK
jgi:hypothetical protein